MTEKEVLICLLNKLGLDYKHNYEHWGYSLNPIDVLTITTSKVVHFDKDGSYILSYERLPDKQFKAYKDFTEFYNSF